VTIHLPLHIPIQYDELSISRRLNRIGWVKNTLYAI
jgi:hypothetical protein